MHSLVVLASFGDHGTVCKFEYRIISFSQKNGNTAPVILSYYGFLSHCPQKLLLISPSHNECQRIFWEIKVTHKNKTLCIKLWWSWDVESLRALDLTGGSVQKLLNLGCLPTPGLIVRTPITALWPCLVSLLAQDDGVGNGGGRSCLPPFPVLSLVHTGYMGPASNAVFSKLCNLWCSCTKEKAGICLCSKCYVYI